VIPVRLDEHGPVVAVGFEQAEEARARLTRMAIPFEDTSDEVVGCSGPPVWVELRLDPEAWEAAGAPTELP